jgi:hypothetical protein
MNDSINTTTLDIRDHRIQSRQIAVDVRKDRQPHVSTLRHRHTVTSVPPTAGAGGAPLGNRWFCSVPGPTYPNRHFLLAGTAYGGTVTGLGTLLFAEGRNAVQVQRWLGHHSPAFTLATYVHLLDGDVGAPLEGVQA